MFGDFCQAIFFYHTCGCRTQNPVICCKATFLGACGHLHPRLVIAKLPHACMAHDGGDKTNVPAPCQPEDPNADEFGGESVTTGPLNLQVLGECPHTMLDEVLPSTMYVPFTLEDVQHEMLAARLRAMTDETGMTRTPTVLPGFGNYGASYVVPVETYGEPEGIYNDQMVVDFGTNGGQLDGHLTPMPVFHGPWENFPHPTCTYEDALRIMPGEHQEFQWITNSGYLSGAEAMPEGMPSVRNDFIYGQQQLPAFEEPRTSPYNEMAETWYRAVVDNEAYYGLGQRSASAQPRMSSYDETA